MTSALSLVETNNYDVDVRGWVDSIARPWRATRAQWQALQFLRYLQAGRAPADRHVRDIVCADGKVYAADEYRPKGHSGLPLPTVLLLHGLSPLAHRDMRIVGLAKAIAAVGFRVVAPQVDEIKALKIGAESIGDIARIVQTVSEEPATLQRRVAIFSASFTGGLALLAAGRAAALPYVSAVCVIGAYACVTSTLRYLMSAASADPYGRYVILKNFIHHSIGDDPEVVAALDAAIADNFHAREVGELQVVLRRIRPRARNLVTTLLENAASRRYHFSRIETQLKPIADELDVVRHAGKIAAPVILLHGEEDRVIPATQSRLLHVAMRRAGRMSNLVVSPLLGHSNARLSLSAAGACLKLSHSVAQYFRLAAGSR